MKNLFTLYLNQYRGFTKLTWLHIFSGMVNSGVAVVTLFLALYFKNQLYFSDFDIGCLMTAFGVGAMIGSLGGGLLCDYITVDAVCLTSLFLNALTLLALPFFHSYNTLLILSVIMGVANFSFTPANRIAVMQSAPLTKQLHVINLRYMMVNVGIGAYIFIGSRLASICYDYLFYASGISILLLGLLLIKRGRTPAPSATSIVPLPVETMTTVTHPSTHTFFISLYFTYLLISLIFAQLRITYPLYLNQYYHFNTQSFGNLLLLNSVMIFLLQVPLNSFLHRFNVLITSGIGALCLGIGMGCLFLGSGFTFAFILCATWSLGEILFFSCMQVAIYDRAHASRKGLHMGTVQAVTALAGIIGPFAGGWLYDIADATILWLTCLLFGVIALVIHYRIRST